LLLTYGKIKISLAISKALGAADSNNPNTSLSPGGVAIAAIVSSINHIYPVPFQESYKKFNPV
jgi:hypothetical protein